MTPALFFFMAGAALLLAASARGTPADARGAALLALATVSLAASICTRTDIVFFTPALIALAHLVSPGRRAPLAAALSLGAAAVIYKLTATLMPHWTVADEGAAQQLRTFLANNYRASNLRFGVATFGFAAGLGLCIAVAVAVAWLARRRAWAPLIYGACFVLPTFLFWVGNSAPSRHFLHAIFGCGLFLALAGERLTASWTARRAALIPAVLALNLGVFPLAGMVARAAGWRSTCSTPSLTCWLTSHVAGGVFARHRTNQRWFTWDQARWERILGTQPEGALLIGSLPDVNGMTLFASRRGQRILRVRSSFGQDSDWLRFSVAGLKLHFWMRSPGARTDPPVRPSGPVYVLSPFPPADMAKLPAGTLDTLGWDEAFLAF
ncbi:MAG: hypothetical protein QM820_03140 [Minicystis sp.]